MKRTFGFDKLTTGGALCSPKSKMKNVK